jgi:hypothetical protein
LGVFSPAQVAVADPGVEYVLEAVESNSPGLKSLRIPIPVANDPYGNPANTFYIAEFRRPIGFSGVTDLADYRVPGYILPIPSGVQMRLHLDRRYTPQGVGANLQTILIHGAYYPENAFYDPFRKIKLTVLAMNGAQARVRVDYNVPPPTSNDLQGPEVTVFHPQPGEVVAGEVIISATASDVSGLKMIRARAGIDGSIFLGDTYAPPFEWHLDTSLLPLGPSQIDLIARDQLGNTTNVTIPVTIVEGTKTPPERTPKIPKDDPRPYREHIRNPN